MRNGNEVGNLGLRPNITEKKNAWKLVPGDIVEKWKPGYLDVRSREATTLQHEEKGYYIPCSRCGRQISQILEEGPAEVCKRYNCDEFRRSQHENIARNSG